MAQSRKTPAVLLRIAAVAVGIALVVLFATGRLQETRFLQWSMLVLAVGWSIALLGLASVLSSPDSSRPDDAIKDALTRLGHQVSEMEVKLSDLALATERTRRQQVPNTSVAPPQTQIDYTQQFQQLLNAMAEVRQLSLLPDADRRQFIQLQQKKRKNSLLKELFALIAGQEWPKAERLLITLETEFPNDDEVAKGRSYLDHSRRLREDETITRTARDVDTLLQASDFTTALEKVRTLLEGFPTSAAARSMQERVEREYQKYLEADAQRMFDDVRQHIEHRSWRRALVHAERVVEMYPNHRLAAQIGAQLKTLRDNAEIEERQELEVRIQELIRAGRLDDAIELAEDVIRQYPNSPQADSLDALLPRLRELARSGAEEFAGLTPDSLRRGDVG